jgi:hypothetical protein
MNLGLLQSVRNDKLQRISVIRVSNIAMETSGEIVINAFALVIRHKLARVYEISSGQHIFWLKKDAPGAVTSHVEGLSKCFCDGIFCGPSLRQVKPCVRHVVSHPRLSISLGVPWYFLSEATVLKQVALEVTWTLVLRIEVVECLFVRGRWRRHILELVAFPFAECCLRIPTLVGHSRRLNSRKLSLRSETVALNVLSFLSQLVQCPFSD